MQSDVNRGKRKKTLMKPKRFLPCIIFFLWREQEKEKHTLHMTDVGQVSSSRRYMDITFMKTA